MRITTSRRISQAFFLIFFLGMCVVATLGEAPWQLSGWPVRWFLQADPLVALGTLLTEGFLLDGLLWALAILLPTFFLGRFYCGWICPLGTWQHLLGWVGRWRGWREGRRPAAVRPGPAGTPHPLTRLRYLLLVAHATAALSGGVMVFGLLDPIPLAHRSVDLLLLPLLDRPLGLLWATPRVAALGGLTATVFVALSLASLVSPRFFCRTLCPLGALLSLAARLAPWRIGRTEDPCRGCLACEVDCQGACAPAGRIRSADCVLCMNCRVACPDDVIRFSGRPPAGGVAPDPNLARRGIVSALAAGAVVGPGLRLDGRATPGGPPGLLRPPGALPEARFLARCISCGRCMRVCPTNVLQPAGLRGGLETLWTPTLDNRMGTSGCQPFCVACGHVCPTGAIRPLSLDEKLGRGTFSEVGPVRLGTAFIDRGRCLPWAMGRPCGVCEEVCPVSPKAIQVEAGAGPEAPERPVVDPAACIGCGICEHACPVSGVPAIRVTAEGESRDPDHAMLVSVGRTGEGGER